MSPALPRRALLAAALALPALARARAGMGPADFTLFCEPTLIPALATLNPLFAAQHDGVAALLAAPAGLLLAQIAQNPAADVLIVPGPTMDEATRRGFIDAASRANPWANPFVLVSRDGATDIASGRIAATDPTPAACYDGMALLGRLGIDASSGRLLGAATSADAAALVLDGTARFALLHQTDLIAHPALRLAVALDPVLVPPTRVAVAVTSGPLNRNARPYLDFLKTPPAWALLREAGLQIVT